MVTTVDQIISALWICMPFWKLDWVLLGGACVCVRQALGSDCIMFLMD